jgi:hypothetical protein
VLGQVIEDEGDRLLVRPILGKLGALRFWLVVEHEVVGVVDSLIAAEQERDEIHGRRIELAPRCPQSPRLAALGDRHVDHMTS